MNESPSKKIIETKGSVTKDQAVALLLGWSVDPIRSAYVNLDRFGITEEQFRTLPSMGQSVDEILTDQLNAAEQMGDHAILMDESLTKVGEARTSAKRLVDQLDRNKEGCLLALAQENEELIAETLVKLSLCNRRIKEATVFKRDITIELAKGTASRLASVLPDDVSDCRTLITIDSLDLWALKKYKLSIKTGRPLKMKNLFEADGCATEDYGPAKVKNIMVILALMAELYAKIAPRYRKCENQTVGDDDGHEADPSFNAIADRVAEHAVLRFGVGSPDSPDAQTIRKLLSLAAAELENRQK